MKLKTTLFTLAIGIIASLPLKAQKDWSKVDFTKEYKGSSKFSGSTGKFLEKNKTFVNNYTISQATVMKGSETSAKAAVFSEASLFGISKEDYQKMVDELYQELISELESAGLSITNGDDVLATNYVQKQIQKDDKKSLIGSTGTPPSYEGKKKISEGSIAGYPAWAVLNDITFPPTNVNRCMTWNPFLGNFYLKTASEGFNLLGINYHVSFASFDGGKGYKDVKLSTQPVIAVNATAGISNPKGGGTVNYKKSVWGSADWVSKMGKTKDNKGDAEFFGLARSADFAVTANSEAYLTELKAIISNLQKDMVKHILSTMK